MTLLRLLAIVVAGAVSVSSARATAASDSLSPRVQALKGEGRYAEAADLVGRILELERRESGVRPFQLVGSEAWQRALAAAARLPTHAREELAATEPIFRALLDAFRSGRIREAADLGERVSEAQRRLLGPNHLDLAETLSGLGLARMALGQYTPADSLLSEALRIKRLVFGDAHPHVAHALDNVSVNLGNWGETERAIALAGEALGLYRSLLGSDAPELGRSLNSLALLHRRGGDYLSAAAFARESIRVAGSRTPPDSAQLATSTNTLALIAGSQGDIAAARPLFEQTFEIRRRLLGEDHPGVARVISSLAELEVERGDTARADSLFRRVLAIRLARFGERAPETLTTQHRLAMLDIERGRLAEGGDALERVLASRRTVLGPDHADVLDTEQALALQRLRAGDARSASQRFESLIAARRRSGGPDYPEVVSDLRHLAEAYLVLGETDRAARLLTEACKRFEVARVRVEEGFTRVAFDTSPYPLLALAEARRGEARGAWEAAERGQGRLLGDLVLEARELPEGDAERLRAIDRRVRQLEAEHLVLRNELSKADAPPDSALRRNEAETRALLLQANAEYAALRRELADHGGQASDHRDLDAVQRRLRVREALVGWIDVPLGDTIEAWTYLVRREGSVVWMRLEDGKRLDDLAGALRVALRAPMTSVVALDSDASTDLLTEAWESLIAPLGDALSEIDALVVVSSSLIAGIPLEAFTGPHGQALGSLFSVTYVPSATMHVHLAERDRTRRPDRVGGRTLWVGDPPFRAEHDTEPPEAPRPMASPAGALLAQRGARSSALSGNPDALRALPRLPWSRREIDDASRLFVQADRLLGRDAAESRVAKLAHEDDLRRYRVVHFGTHALVDDEDPARSALVLSQLERASPPPEGLLPTDCDGLLTAGEITRGWSLEADLVMMSACETGLGRRLGGEGYVGLAHAFLQAGAASVLASLWPVDDQATALFVRRFYETWTTPRGGHTPAKTRALDEARAWLAAYTDETGRRPYAHPAYWAAFILIGSGD